MLNENSVPRSYYEIYLSKILEEENDGRTGNKDFIESRSEKASEIFENARLEGKTVEQAHELAMEALTERLFD